MKVAFQMEHMRDTVRGETHSLLMIEESCKRGFEVFHYHPDDISLTQGGLFAPVATLRVDQSKEEYFELGEYTPMDLSEMDIIFFRQDPPVNMNYYTNTVLLDMLKDAGVFVVNDPHWIRNMPDKLSVFDFKEYLPPTLVSRDMAQIEAFFEAHGDIVIKPLYSFHGHGIERSSSAAGVPAMLETVDEPLMFQPFLPEIYDGNKRILYFGGEIVGAIKSVPLEEGDFRIYRQSKDTAYEPDADEMKMAEEIGAMLKERGLVFVGIDLIGKYLTEINVGSVGSLVRFNEIYGGAWEAKLWDVIQQEYRKQSS